MEARRVCGDVGVLDGGGGTEKEVVAGENGMLAVGPCAGFDLLLWRTRIALLLAAAASSALWPMLSVPLEALMGVCRRHKKSPRRPPAASRKQMRYIHIMFSNSSWRIHAVQSSVSSLLNGGFVILAAAVFLTMQKDLRRVSREYCAWRWCLWWCFDSRRQWPTDRSGCKARMYRKNGYAYERRWGEGHRRRKITQKGEVEEECDDIGDFDLLTGPSRLPFCSSAICSATWHGR